MSAPDPVASQTHSKTDIIRALGEQADRLYTFFLGVPSAQFCVGSAARWSPAQHAQHLVQSMRPLTSALRWRALVRALQWAHPLAGRVRAPGWTKARAEARTYTDIRRDYRAVLRQGARAPRRYRPSAGAYRTQAELARAVQVAVLRLQEVVRGWDDQQLDTRLLPHPLLGLLSVREMLLFTLYHNEHHVNGVRRLLS